MVRPHSLDCGEQSNEGAVRTDSFVSFEYAFNALTDIVMEEIMSGPAVASNAVVFSPIQGLSSAGASL